METHTDKSTDQKVQCPAGCGWYDKSRLQDHLMSERSFHMVWIMIMIDNIRKEIGSLTQKINMKLVAKEASDIISMQNQILDLESRSQQAVDLNQIPNIDQKIQQAVDITQQALTDRIKINERKVDMFIGIIANCLTRELDKINAAMINLRRHTLAEMAENLRLTQMANALKRKNDRLDIRIFKRKVKVDSLQSASYNGSLIWKISDFTQKQQNASQGNNISIYSPAFYTSHHGYQVCARLYPNGEGMGHGTHLSLFFVVMRGQFDALQAWPFKQRVTFRLVNQNGGEHILDSFRPDPSSSSFKRPSSDMNIASGCPLFMRLDSLTNPNNGFLLDDTLFIKVDVDVSDLQDPLSNT